jgi:GGDEF domain-containing protein
MKTRHSADMFPRSPEAGQESGNTMISIKRFLEQRRNGPGPGRDVVQALTQMGRLLLEAMATHMVRGNETDFKLLRGKLNGLARRMEEPQPAMSLLGISSDAVEAFKTYCQSTTEYLRQQNEERQSMVAMLTDTVADLSGQTDASVAVLQTIEKQIECASELDDIRVLRANLAESLRALRQAAAQQRSSSVATVERLRGQIAMAQAQIHDNSKHSRGNQDEIDLIPELSEGPIESLATSYVAAFRLQRAEHIASRFGEAVKRQMLSMIATQLKTVLGPKDRLLRRKDMSFVMFINSTDSVKEIRGRLLSAVGKTSQQYIEVGSKSVLLSVGVDWVVFPQADRPSLEAVYTEVDAFLANTRRASSPVMTTR